MDVSVRDAGKFTHIDISIKNTTGIDYGKVKAWLAVFTTTNEELVEGETISAPHFKNGDTHVFEFKFKKGHWFTTPADWNAAGIHPHFNLVHITE